MGIFDFKKGDSSRETTDKFEQGDIDQAKEKLQAIATDQQDGFFIVAASHKINDNEYQVDGIGSVSHMSKMEVMHAVMDTLQIDPTDMVKMLVLMKSSK